jgi:hypothetical protein
LLQLFVCFTCSRKICHYLLFNFSSLTFFLFIFIFFIFLLQIQIFAGLYLTSSLLWAMWPQQKNHKDHGHASCMVWIYDGELENWRVEFTVNIWMRIFYHEIYWFLIFSSSQLLSLTFTHCCKLFTTWIFIFYILLLFFYDLLQKFGLLKDVLKASHSSQRKFFEQLKFLIKRTEDGKTSKTDQERTLCGDSSS